MNKNNPSYRKLKKGEFSNVEQKYTVDKNFVFTGGKIENYNDVAFIFRSLQNSSIENSFMLYEFEDKKSFIQHLCMGTVNSVSVYFQAINDAISRFSPKKAYFIHNHPSGNLQCSNADIEVFKSLKSSFGDILRDGIIINTISGEFAVFSDEKNIIGNIPSFSKEAEYFKLNVLKFDRSVFKEDIYFDSIKSSKDVASFVSAARFSSERKLSMLVLDTKNNITANLHLPYSNILNNKQALLNDIKAYISRFKGSSCILYGKQNYLSLEQEKTSDIINDLNKVLKPVGTPITDYIDFISYPEIDFKDYKSYSDEGLLKEPKPKLIVKTTPSIAKKALQIKPTKKQDHTKGRGL